MRYFFTATLVVASLAGHVYGHRQVAPSSSSEGRVGYRRKTLGFGPEHPHAVFRSTPYQVVANGFTPQDSSIDPFEVARIFLDDVLPTKLSDSSSYIIRKDSYTDKNTGVTHVYVRQLVNGLEVTDGDININIKDGVVLSYGNSVCCILHISGISSDLIILRHSSSMALLLPHSLTPRSAQCATQDKSLVTSYHSPSRTFEAPALLILSKLLWVRLLIRAPRHLSSNTCLKATVVHLTFPTT